MRLNHSLPRRIPYGRGQTTASSYEATFERLNGAESLAHAKAAGEAFKNGDQIGYLKENFRALGASMEHEANAVKALFTPGNDGGNTKSR